MIHPDLTGAQTLSVDLLKSRAAALLPKIAEGAATRERERILPHAQIRALADAQLLTWRIPQAAGGAGASVRDVIGFVIDVAAADSNVAQALRPGFAFLEGLRLGHTEGDPNTWYARFLAGDVFGNAGWEVGGANGAISSRITRDGDGYKVNGSKYYSTGSLYANWVSAVALDEEDKPVSFILPRDREGLVLVDDFDAMGQRLTASGTTLLEGVTVHPHEIRRRIGQGDRRSPVTPFLQLFLGAVMAGIARAAREDAVAFASQFARPIKHSSASRSVDDPYVRFSVGEIAARAYAAEAVVLQAADAIERAYGDLEDQSLSVRASIEVAQAQFIAADNALKAGELIFDVGGASTTARTHNLDRHWRNARTVANHNPRHWKAAVAGGYHLTGEEPPASGLF